MPTISATLSATPPMPVSISERAAQPPSPPRPSAATLSIGHISARPRQRVPWRPGRQRSLPCCFGDITSHALALITAGFARRAAVDSAMAWLPRHLPWQKTIAPGGRRQRCRRRFSVDADYSYYAPFFRAGSLLSAPARAFPHGHDLICSARLR